MADPYIPQFLHTSTQVGSHIKETIQAKPDGPFERQLSVYLKESDPCIGFIPIFVPEKQIMEFLKKYFPDSYPEDPLYFNCYKLSNTQLEELISLGPFHASVDHQKFDYFIEVVDSLRSTALAKSREAYHLQLNTGEEL